MNRPYRPISRTERRLQSFRAWLRALCVACYGNPWFFFAMFCDCVALVVFWWVVTV